MSYQGVVNDVPQITAAPPGARQLLRTGAVCACLGGTMAVIGNALHGPSEVTTEGLQHLAHDGAFGLYGADHFLLALAVIFVSNGLAAITLSVEREPGASWARLGFVNVLMGGAVMLAALGIDGFALVPTAKYWLNASPADQATIFHIAQALFSAFIGMFALAVFVYFGCVPLLYGTAFLTSGAYPRWVGLAAIAGGLIGIPLGMALAFSWITSLTYMILFGTSATFFAIWVIAAGVLLWRRTGQLS
jgi:hypothetical protein